MIWTMVIIFALLVIGVGYLFWCFAHAEDGYEDGEGFHPGKKEDRYCDCGHMIPGTGEPEGDPIYRCKLTKMDDGKRLESVDQYMRGTK